MIKTCSFCGIELAHNNVFDWYNQPICYECLKQFSFDEKKAPIPNIAPVSGSAELSVSKILFSLDGRINRARLWFYEAVILNLVFIGSMIIGFLVAGESGLFIGGITCGLLLLWPWIALHVKRAHDRNRSGAFVLLSFIPIVNLWVGIDTYFLRGTAGPNTYGPDPLGN